jgi:hypothetical protein
VKLPFAVSTLERGMLGLEDQGLLRRRKTTIHPFLKQRLSGPRVGYTNKFLGRDDVPVDAGETDLGDESEDGSGE